MSSNDQCTETLACLLAGPVPMGWECKVEEGFTYDIR